MLNGNAVWHNMVGSNSTNVNFSWLLLNAWILRILALLVLIFCFFCFDVSMACSTTLSSIRIRQTNTSANMLSMWKQIDWDLLFLLLWPLNTLCRKIHLYTYHLYLLGILIVVEVKQYFLSEREGLDRVWFFSGRAPPRAAPLFILCGHLFPVYIKWSWSLLNC